MRWEPLPLNNPLYLNQPEGAVLGYQTAIENSFINEQGGHTRFPGLIPFADVGGNGRIYLSELGGDMIAATSKGQVYQVDRSGNVTNKTGVPVSGGRRVIFAQSDRELTMAAGGPIIRLRGEKTELLSEDAPHATHVGWIDGYLVAAEPNSGRFFNSEGGDISKWNPLDVFSADGNPDDVNSLMITPFREMMIGGANSVEQFERNLTGSVPFFRRWAVGEGVKLPYGMIFADNAVWTMNSLTEFVRFSGQVSVAQSAEIGRLLEKVDDWSDAWIGGFPDKPLHTLGQKFILLQLPHATTPYGTKGITLVLDYRAKRWFTLYGWDEQNGVPARWPGWSHWTIWGRVFVGGEGKIYELSDTAYTLDGKTQRWLVRTGHAASGSLLQVQNLRLRVRRGFSGNTSSPEIGVRCSRDGKPFGNWVQRSLGKAGQTAPFIEFGQFGSAGSFQFEISTSDDCPVDLMGADIMAVGLEN
ncbi:hypothetical protein QMT40_001782 [Parvibaculaceae bacterium PLY_AMNH_Bact1]|nr:hypothetical protein QMT40_001782 [Parvibaculaceae bacterium PLY_AMNH_Bact1]